MATKTQTGTKTASKNGAKTAAGNEMGKPAKAAATTRGKATSAGRRKLTVSASADASKTTPTAPAAPATPAAPAKTATPVAASAQSAAGSTAPADALRRPDLIQAIADRVSLKRSEAKMVFDVVLDEIGKALDANDEVIVPPLGKMMVKKRIDKPKGAMLTVKLKRAEADPTAGDVAPLAKPAEQG